MGLSFADIQNLSREATAMYPPRELPVFTEISEKESRIAEIQIGFADRLRKPSVAAQPTLKRKDLNEAFFPPGIFASYFNPKKKRKLPDTKNAGKPRMNLDEFGDDDDDEKSGEDRSDAGSNVAEEDYDVDEEYDNDYAENYFDNGEGDDMDDLGGGGGGDEGGGGDYD
ncbi:hypothetical protein C0992_004556 [Termitomyces sp. T32_za158]|nr:hypothetical protein C0992_004556 [Termitomyces sp. T32_za158]